MRSNRAMAGVVLVALGAMTSLAKAENSVSIYGLIDASLESVNNVGVAGSTLSRMPTNTGTAPSRLGFRGSEDLGNGLAAVFTLEMGIAPNTGTLNQGGRGFGRQAFVGLSSPYGTFSLGRQYTMTFWSGLDADILGGGIYGTGSLDSYLPNARADNAFAWKGKFGGLTMGATYSLGRDAVNAGPSPAGTNCPGGVVGDTAACREWSVMAKYDEARWGVAFANDRLYGRTLGPAPDAIFGGLNSSSKTDNRMTLNGWFKVGDAKIGGGVIRRSNDGSAAVPHSNLWHVGVAYPVSPVLTLSAQAVSLRYNESSAYNSNLYAIRGDYQFSKRTAVYLQMARINNNASAAVSVSGGAPGSNPVAGQSQTGVNAGIRLSF